MEYIDTGANFSPDHKCRFTLTRQWARSKKQALLGMLNPSNANHKHDDPTIRRVTELLDALGYGGYRVVNWSPYISSSPRKMLEQMNSPSALLLKNLEYNLEVVRSYAREADTSIVGWGNDFPENLPVGKFLSTYTTNFMSAMSNDWKSDLLCFGQTLRGAPKHPLARGKHRIITGTKLRAWVSKESH